MRPLYFAYGVLAAPLLGCSSQTGTTTNDAGGIEASTDTSSSLDSSSLDGDTVPDTQVCSGEPSQCLFGSAEVFADDAAVAQFDVKPTGLRVQLFRQFPTVGIGPIDQQLVANDHTWAFSGLEAWAHYY